MAKVILFAVFLLVVGGVAFLAISDVPAPVKTIEKSIDTKRFTQ